ncbi:HNH endonuclease [Pseudonocardia sp. RS11V-5]|uniref:HNH endonuclease signature motif containing protein n=1 Tax=Pseudonocardia terrae TaxID=2905831 RepID=UPI001E44FD7C|nr:HNH endonuclease signature motif containing protein [Pseudonocardia terrae]MCE3556435.1 HNH endonuclease [Pseudonocardia terrae]
MSGRSSVVGGGDCSSYSGWQCKCAPQAQAYGRLLAAVADAQLARNAIDARMLAAVAELESRGLAPEHGYRDTADLLQSVQRVAAGVAKVRVRAARAVVPPRSLSGEELPAELPMTALVLAVAEISFEHVRVIQQTLAALPAHLESDHREPLERDLAELARTLDPEALRRAGKHALALLDPDGPRPRDGAPTRTRLRFTARGEGFEARGWFDRESAAILRTALSPLSEPQGEHDAGNCEETGCEHLPGEHKPDPRSIAEREGDALVELCRRMLDSGALPLDGGTHPHVTVTIPLSELRSAGAGLLAFGDGTLASAIKAEDVRRWACDAAIVPIVLGSRGEPLDVGRRSRLVTPALRRALEQRDGGCAQPGCCVPAQWAAAHHIVHWSRGGATALDNLVLLCPRHHRLIHKGEWRITMEDGLPVFHPPWWAGGSPGRNLLHRPDLIGRVDGMGTSLHEEPALAVLD